MQNSERKLPRRRNAVLNAALKFLRKYIIISSVRGKSFFYMDEDSFRRACALCLGLTMLIFLLCALALNLFEGNMQISMKLAGAAVVPVIAVGWLICSKQSVYGPILLMLFALLILGGLLLMYVGAPDGSSLFWFVLFPPMCVYCLGLRHGSKMVAGFYLLLLLIMMGPLQSLLVEPVSMPIRKRFLLTVLSSYIFAAFGEHIRSMTNRSMKALVVQLEQETLTDPLTGLGNRRDFHHHFSWVKAKTIRDEAPFALAMIDIDHFKQVNDTYGHEVGDSVLLHLTGILTEHLRATDRLFRWGGEEFIILMADTCLEDAKLVVERTRQVIEQTPYVQGKLSIDYTISVGLFCNNNASEINDALAEADRHLYIAKKTGRNRVVSEQGVS